MASKKYLLFMVAAFCLSMSMYSQVKIGTTYDSTQIPAKRMPQHNEFLQGTNNFPAKPRNQWEIGVKLGTFNISGDVPSQFAFPSFGLHVRKAFGYVFSMRLEYMYGTGKGLSWLPSENFAKNSAWVNAGYSAPGGTLGAPYDLVYYNYKTKAQDLSLQGVVTLNNIRFHKAKNRVQLLRICWYRGYGLRH